MLIISPETHLSQSVTRARHLPDYIISPCATSLRITFVSHVRKIVVVPWSFLLKTARASSSFSFFPFATYFKYLSKSTASTAAPLNSSIIFLWPPALNFSYLCFPSRLPRTLLWPTALTAIFSCSSFHSASTSHLGEAFIISSMLQTILNNWMLLLCNLERNAPLFSHNPSQAHLPLLIGAPAALPAPIWCCRSDLAKHCDTTQDTTFWSLMSSRLVFTSTALH